MKKKRFSVEQIVAVLKGRAGRSCCEGDSQGWDQ